MIKLKTLHDAIDNISIDNFNNEIIKEILFDLYLFEREFNKELYPNNEIIILDTNEEYEPPFDIPELELQIGNYIKRLYIISDSGEGLIVYLKTKENYK
jgi:hypothetical protein